MNFDPEAVEAWARRDEAEETLFAFLNELAQPTLAILRDATGSSPEDEAAAQLIARGKHGATVVHPWKNQPNVQFAVPSALTELRFRIQFLAAGGKPYFTVEARYEHPKESLAGDEALEAATAALRRRHFDDGNDGYGYYWARVIPADDWLYEGAGALERLLAHVRENTQYLAEAHIFSSLERRTPVTPAETPE